MGDNLKKEIEFATLHCHSNLGSMKDGLSDINELFDKVKSFGQKSVALTDHGYLAGFYDAFQAYKRTGVKFIPGNEIYFVHSLEPIKSKTKRRKYEKRKHLTLLCKNEKGYRNLLKMNFESFKNFQVTMGKVYPRTDWNLLEKYSEGIIATTGCSNSPVNWFLRQGNYEDAEEVVKKLNKIFKDRFYVEIHAHHIDVESENNPPIKQKELNEALIEISKKYNIPLMAATDTHYIDKRAADYHDVMLAINSKKPVDDPNRHRYGINEFYVKDGRQVYSFFNEYYGEEIAKEAVENTIIISDSCENPDYMENKGNRLPEFPVSEEKDYDEFIKWKTERIEKEELKEADSEALGYMRYKCLKGFLKKYGHLNNEDRKEVWKRVLKELKVLEGNNFSSYMLVVADYINWARNNGILVSPGRGSCGGCIVAYLLDIHSVDPIKFDLIFERFQNKWKKDLPDIDTDFTSAGRDKVKEYVIQKYGKDKCAQISNINTYTPKNVIPDLIKSMRNVLPNLIAPGENYVTVSNKIRASIPDKNNNNDRVSTIEEALEISKDFAKFAEQAPEVIEYASKIVGNPKDYATHAAAMVISDIPLVDFIPLRVDKNGSVAVQYDKKRSEMNGLVKMDFLALSTLDVLDETFKNIKTLHNKGISKMEDIPLDDEETYEMLQKGHTNCVFQLGQSGTMVALCKYIKPTDILDIAIINALGRPSSAEKDKITNKNERQVYIERRRGISKITYIHPSLKKALSSTYGLCIMEDQLMEVAKYVAGWDLNKADALRKITKDKDKNSDLMLKTEAEFVADSMKFHNMPHETAQEIWDKVIKVFSGYGFNKAHAVAYSIMGYYTAYLKRHYPVAFLAAYLKVVTNKNAASREEKVNIAKRECKRFNIKIIPPDVNQSSAGYEVLDSSTIVMGFEAIKGLGEKAINSIVENQPYSSLAEFFYKTDGRVVNKSKMEALAKAGCFNSLNLCRKDVHDFSKKNRAKVNTYVKSRDGYAGELTFDDLSLFQENQEWSDTQMLRYEQEVLGELVSGSLKDLFPGFFTDDYHVTPLSRLKSLPDREHIFVEVLIKTKLREFKIKRGKYIGQPMIKYQVEDMYGTNSEMTVAPFWPETFKKAKSKIKEGFPIKAKCQVSEFNGFKSIMLREITKVY